MESWIQPWELKASIEAIMVAADEPVKVSALASGLGVTEIEIEDALQDLGGDLMEQQRGVRIRHRAGAVRLEVKPPLIDVVCLVLPKWSAKELSKAAYETLALIAYEQGITTTDLTERRGRDCNATLQTLRNRKLVARSAQLGPKRQKRWRTTPHFLDAFNLNNLDELYLAGAKERLFPQLFNDEEQEEEVDEMTEEPADEEEYDPEDDEDNETEDEAGDDDDDDDDDDEDDEE